MTTRSRTSFGSTLLALLHRAVSFPRAWHQRRAIGELGGLDDRMLADIGLTRHDLTSALAQPLFVDASEVLADRVREMHAGRRASALEAFEAGQRYRRDGRWAA